MENKAIIPETEDTKKPHILEAAKAAGETGITLTAENIGNYDFSGLEFVPAEE